MDSIAFFWVQRGVALGSSLTPPTMLGEIQTALRIDTLSQITWPHDIEILHLPHVVYQKISEADFRAGAAFIHQAIQAERGLFICCEDGTHYAPLFMLAYWVEYAKMSLPTAFTWMALRYPYTYPERESLLDLVQAYGLPYPAQQVLDNHFPEWLLDESEITTNQVIEGLFISGAGAMRQAKSLWNSGVRSILRLDRGSRGENWPTTFEVCHLPIMDRVAIEPAIFDEATAFMHKQRQAGGVLVHCQMGVSRAATLTLAYLIRYEGMSLPEAFRVLHAARPIVQPNFLLLISLAEHYQLSYTPEQIINPFFLDDLLRDGRQNP